MFQRKAPSPSYKSQQKLRETTSAKLESAKFVRSQEFPLIPSVPEDAALRYFKLNKQGKRQRDLIDLIRKKRFYPIAPDALIPNSSCRQIFEKPDEETTEVKLFKLRLDILNNLPKKEYPDSDDDDSYLYDDDDLEFQKSTQTGPASRRAGARLPKVASRQREAVPDVLERMLNEPWWKKAKEETPDLLSKLLYLCEILRLKQADSYPSACSYVTEIFRAYGIDDSLLNQIVIILLQHLQKEGHDSLDAHTARTISQFMIETKEIVIRLLEYTQKCETNVPLRQEVINAIKYLTEVNNTDDIDLIFDYMSVVRDSPEEDFSLKMIIHGIKAKIRAEATGTDMDEDNTDVHPLLKKISEERWFPRKITIITLDTIIDVIVDKLPTATKSLLKTLMNHMTQIDREIGYTKDQFNRLADAVLGLLSHSDADFRIAAATHLGNLGRETKSIDITLLHSFVNDARVLVRTECGDTLKKLTNVTSDIVLADCAEAIPYLQTLPEESFSLENYLKEKNRVPTPPPKMESSFVQEEEKEPSDVIPTTISPPSPPSSPPSNPPPPPKPQPSSTTLSKQMSVTTSLSTATPIEPVTRVSFHDKDDSTIVTSTSQSKPSRIRISNPMIRQRKQTLPPIKPTSPIEGKHSSMLPNNSSMWDSYEKQNELKESMVNETTTRPDPVETLIDEHKQQMAFYRAMLNRRVLIPHKVSMSQIFGDHAHVVIDTGDTNRAHPSAMKISDLENNQRTLNDVEHNQLLSSLVIRTIQVHRQYEKFSPGLSNNFAPALTISPMPLHSTPKGSPPLVLPPIKTHTPSPAQMSRLRARAGVNIRKAQTLETLLGQLLEPTQGSSIVSMASSSQISSLRTVEVTHAWLLVQILKSRGITDSETITQKLIECFPKFLPLLQTRIPHTLVPTIWNDPLVKQIASFFGQPQEEPLVSENVTPKQSDTRPTKHVPVNDDDKSVQNLDYAIRAMGEDSKRRLLPPIRTQRGNQFRHFVKFGFRELDSDTLDSPPEESTPRARRRRVYMHFMLPASDHSSDRHEALRHVDRSTAFVPIVSRAPVCH